VVKGSSLTDLGLRAISPRFSDRQLMCTCSDKTLLIYFTIFDKIVFLMPTLSKGPAFGCLKKKVASISCSDSRGSEQTLDAASFFLFLSIVPMLQASTSLVGESGDYATHEKMRIHSGFMTQLKMPISYSLPSFLSIWFLTILIN